MKRIRTGAVALLALLILAGCAAQKSYRLAERDMRRQAYDRAVLHYSKAVALDPGNSRYEVALARAKIKASGEHFEKGRRFLMAQQLELAIAEFQQTLALNPSNQHARVELDRALRQWQIRQAGPSELEELKELARRNDLGPPRLNARSNIAINMAFDEVELGKIFEPISKASQINFIYDDKVDLKKPHTIDVGNVTLEKALDILMLQTKNFYKPIDEFTLLIAPDTRQKRQEYEDQVIRTFFLSNADTKTVVTLLRSLLQSRQIAENADLNSVTIKDTPAKVAIADRIIQANDKAKGEVIVDVELLEINRQISQTLGIDLTSKNLTLQFRDGTPQSLPVNGLEAVRQAGNWFLGPVPNVTLDFLRSDSDSRTIAQPQLRVSEGEQAEILIGDRVPIPATSFNTQTVNNQGLVPITSFTYQNVGITVQVEPRVHHNKEVTLQVQVEVSQVTGEVAAAGPGALSQPIIGTRQIQTVIRLRDGETNLLAGLIQRTNSDTQGGIPGLSDVPGLGRLFGTNDRSESETDIILTLTPRIIRIPDITEQDLQTLWVGTEDNMELRGPARNALGVGAFGGDPVALNSQGDPINTVSEFEERNGDGDSDDATGDETTADAGDSDAEEGDANTDPAAEENTPEAAPEEEEDERSNRGRRGRRNRSRLNPEPDEDADSDQPPQQAGVLMGLNPPPQDGGYAVGTQFVIQVQLVNGENVGSVPYHLKYNPQVLQFLQPAQEGDFLRQGADTVFLAPDVGGEIVVGHSRMGGSGVSGAGLLATFQFLAIAPGDAGFQFTSASVKDPQARNIPSFFSPASIQVTP